MRFAVFLAAGLVALTAILHAQSDDDDDEMDYYPLVFSGNHLRFGFRYIGGPKVSFGKLGNVPYNVTLFNPTDTADVRTYNDGTVGLDTRVDKNGNQPNDGMTNTWSYSVPTQVTPDGNIAFHAYSANTLGASMKASTTSAAGWELQAGRNIGRIGHKITVSLVGGFSFTNLNAKVDGTVPATLTATTDVFSLNGQTVPTAPYTAPSTTTQPVYDSNGNLVLNADGSGQTTTIDTTTLLGNQPTRTTTTSAGNVQGHWQIKGAYYTFRLGTMFELPITERFKLDMGVGAAVLYVGSQYIVQEQIEMPDATNPVLTKDVDERAALLPAIYADADAQYWMTERTGVYMGATYQKSGSYNQTLGGRTANIDLGSTYGLQSGITLRF